MRVQLSLIGVLLVTILDWLLGLAILEIYHRGHFRSREVLQWLFQPFLLGLPFLGLLVVFAVLLLHKLTGRLEEDLPV